MWKGDYEIPHKDHIEMSGKTVSTVLRYGIDYDGTFEINKSMVWPLLRTIPNNTHASLMRRYDWSILNSVTANGKSLIADEKVEEICLKGILSVKSSVDLARYGKWEVIREYLPSTELPALVELYSVINKGNKDLYIEIPECGFTATTNPDKGVKGSYTVEGKVYGCLLYTSPSPRDS